MTSTLPANNAFGRDIFAASALYGRNAYSNSIESTSNRLGRGTTTSIWQTSKDDLRPIRTQMAGNEHMHQSPRDLQIIPPRIKDAFRTASNFSGKRSPTVYQGDPSSSTEPLSAHSRSNNDSAIPTPVSNVSIGDQFSMQSHAVQDTKQSRMVNTESYQVQGNLWTNVKEFRPKLSLIADRWAGPDGAQKSSASDLSGSRSTPFNTIWSLPDSEVSMNASAIRNDFRPVLPAVDTPYDSETHASQGYSDGRGAGRSPYPKQNSFVGTFTGSYQAQYGEYNPPRNHFENGSARAPTRPSLGGELYDHSTATVQNGYGHSYGIQTSTQRNFPVSYTQDLSRHRAPLDDEFIPAEYYTRPTTNFPYQSTLARAGPGLPNYQQYSRMYPEDTTESGLQPCSSSSYHFAPDSHGGYYVVSNMNTPYVNTDSISERPAETQQIYRSPLLEEFRVNKSRKYELKDIYDHVVEFSGDQLGSRFIQQKLEVANSDEKDRIFNEVARDSRQLMTDVFGNYVIQKMFEHGNQSQKKLLASHMKGHVYALSLQAYGCRVVQKALEHILTDQQGSLIKELDGNVLKVVENQNGNHVIQKAIEMIPGEHVQFIVDAHRGHVHHLSKHPYGCRVIQRMLEFCQPHAKRQILDELHLNISDLIQDAFGNYVVQHVIANGEPQDRKIVIDKVHSRLLENAMHKFASNVVEKALDHADEHQRRLMLQKLIGRDETGQSTTTKLLTHQYGNYVIQKSTFHLSGQNLAITIEEMENYLSQLQRVSSGKQVTALQKSVLEARNRLNNQRYATNIMQHVPTHPRTNFVRR